MTPIKMLAFAEELTKTAKPSDMGTLLGQKVTKTVKPKAKGLSKGAGLVDPAGNSLAKILQIAAGKAKKSVKETILKHPKKSMAAGAGAAFAAGRASKRK